MLLTFHPPHVFVTPHDWGKNSGSHCTYVRASPLCNPHDWGKNGSNPYIRVNSLCFATPMTGVKIAWIDYQIHNYRLCNPHDWGKNRSVILVDLTFPIFATPMTGVKTLKPNYNMICLTTLCAHLLFIDIIHSKIHLT